MAIKIGTEIFLPKIIKQIGAPETRMQLLLKGMTEEQLTKIAGTLSEEQLADFLEIYKEMAAKADADKQQTAAVSADVKSIVDRSDGVNVKDKPETPAP